MADQAGLAHTALQISDLHVHFGGAHILQGVNLVLVRGLLAVVGRNGMGKTTLCTTIMGLTKNTSGNVRVFGGDVGDLPPNQIVSRQVGYVPQGRRIWPSLSVDEHLRVAFKRHGGAWTPERVYDLFPRLAERKTNGGAQLSGGEQQMLAIGRALLTQPRLLIMDEPTEGLAPVVVDNVIATLSQLVHNEGMSVLLVEQNLDAALRVANQVAIMVNGSVTRRLPASQLASDKDLQRQLLGINGPAR